MGVFYPNMVVTLRVRFDEAFVGGDVPDAVEVDDLAQKGLVPGEQRKSLLPDMLAGQKGTLSHIVNRLPKSGSLDIPGYRQAAKFSFTFDFRDLPIDPRLIRSAGIEIFLGVVEGSSFAAGMTQTPAQNQERASIISRSEANKIFVGIVDRWSVTHGERGSEISMEGRDLRGLLLDMKMRASVFDDLDLRKPIDEVVKQIMGKSPTGQLFHIVADPQDWPVHPPLITGVVPSPVREGGQPRGRKGASGKDAHSKPPVDTNVMSFWDLITYYCTQVGAVPFFVGETLHIKPSASLYDQRKADHRPTPFLDGKPREITGVGNPLVVRRLVFGRDIRELSFERKYTGKKAAVVEVVSVDTSNVGRGESKMLKVRWPPETKTKKETKHDAKTHRTSVAPSGTSADKEILKISKPGINDVNQLLEIAKNIYEEIGRGEMGGSVQTKNLASFGGDNADPDLLRLKPGDAVDIAVDITPLAGQIPHVSELTEQERRDFDGQVASIVARIGDEKLARAIVLSSRGGAKAFQQFWRVHNVKYEWSASSGVAIAFDFNDYIEVRANVEGTSTGANTKQAGAKGGAKTHTVPKMKKAG